LGHKRDIGEVFKNLQLTSFESYAYLLCRSNENVPLRSSEGCSRAGLDFKSVFHENNDKIVSVPFCPDHSKNAQFAVCVGEDQVSMQDVPNTPVRHASRLIELTCRSPQTAADRRELRTTDQVAFYTSQSLLHSLPYPSTDCIWRCGFM
jgi:hypothetical protein